MLKKIFQHIFLSCTNLKWYHHLQEVPAKQHIFAFFLIILFGAVFQTIKISITDLPTVTTNIIALTDDALENYPEDLQFSWADNKLEFNRDELIIAVPDVLSETSVEDSLYTVFVSKTPVNQDVLPELLEKYSVVGDQTTFYFNNDEYRMPLYYSEVFPVDSFSLDKDSLTQQVTDLKQNLRTITFIAIASIFLLSFIALLFLRVLSIVIDSVLIYILLKFNAKKYTYKQIVLICINVMIPSEIIYQMSTLYNSTLPIYALIFWIYVVVVISSHYVAYEKQQVANEKFKG